MKVMWLINFAVPIITEGEGTTAIVNYGCIYVMLNVLPIIMVFIWRYAIHKKNQKIFNMM